jgi:pyridoxal phosphate enzyme (YggS family)
MPSIAENLARVRGRVADAVRRSGRPADAVRLVAVSKTHSAAAVAEAFAAGQREFGENRVQEALGKMPQCPEGAVWHLVGHLQSNKAKLVPGAFALVHSVDSLRLAETLNRHAQAAGYTVNVLIQVNLTGEASKSGVHEAAEVEPLVTGVMASPALRPLGLMTIPDPSYDEVRTRAVFARMRELLERLRSACGAGPTFCELSMGMSQDFEWAIEEGATLVRVGTAIFGSRPAAPSAAD